ncbi:MAG: hypothetical protein WC223_09440 [Bacteroidales bacterium]|jgi:hypothetical protein
MKKIIILLLFLISAKSYSQEVYTSISNTAIYEFLDELANGKIISLNSAIKPYSRIYIAKKLKEADEKGYALNKRQKKELAFYLKDYGKELPGLQMNIFLGKHFIKKFSKDTAYKNVKTDLFYYKDSIFTLTINPVLGYKYFLNENGDNYHRWNGAEGYAYIGKHLGVYSSLRDNYESELFAKTQYLIQQQGGIFKFDGKGGDFEEERGGIIYSWKWGSIGILKDQFTWGNNYNGANIFSDKPPSFPFIKLHLNPVKWLDFTYIHGWIVSDVTDSLRSYKFMYGTRTVIYPKFLAANILTITPVKFLNISIGNSIIYSDIGVHPGYLIPVMFYKAVDHSLNTMSNNTGQNAQMYFDISSRNIKNLHLYTSFYVDEISIRNMWNDSLQSNWLSGKLGFRLSSFPIKNLSFIAEYTRSNPFAYRHFIPTTTFESNKYNLGYYLKDNAEEYYFCLRYKPIRGLTTDISYTDSKKGPEYVYTGTAKNGLGLPFMKNVEWQSKAVSVKISYELINDVFLSFEYINNFITGNYLKYNPEFYWGNTNTYVVGANIGF